MSLYAMKRGWMDSDVFGKAPYSDREAWCWIIGEARYEAGMVPQKGGGIPVYVERGQLTSSVRFMAEKFQWSTNRVLRFLEKLKKWRMIVVKTETGQNMITVCNYDEYQFGGDSDGDTLGNTGGDTLGDSDGDKLEELLINSRNSKTGACVDLFSEFLKAYPSRGAEPNPPTSARTQYDRLVETGESPETLLNAARGYADSVKASGQAGTKFVKTTANFLRDGTWKAFKDWKPSLPPAALTDIPDWQKPLLKHIPEQEVRSWFRGATLEDGKLTARSKPAATFIRQRYDIAIGKVFGDGVEVTA